MGNFAENLNLGNRFRPPPPDFFFFFFFFAFVALLQEEYFPKRIKQKSFQCEMRAIVTESLVHETLFNKVVYGAVPMHIIMHNL